jgi:Fic family protein
MDSPADIGATRQRRVIIRDPSRPDGIVFIPPDHGDVAKLLNELMDFIQANLKEIEPVILAGLFHKQALNIHPYMDGNGCSTRYFNMVGERGDFYDLGDSLDFMP